MISISRRAAFVALGGAALSGRAALSAPGKPAASVDPSSAFSALEGRSGGRLGVAALHTGTNDRLLYRAEERFALCSTFKLLAAALVLSRADRGDESLERRVMYNASALVPYSPATKDHADRDGMTMAEICKAAVMLSDNTAGNLMLESFGGPPALTAYMRSLGDEMTRLDRTETSLNENAPGDVRDTTTPAAILGPTGAIMLGSALSGPSRELLNRWLLESKTGDKRVRAGLPKGWMAGVKTGTGENGAANDIGVAWPPANKPPIVFAVYTSGSKASFEAKSAILAEAGRIVASWAAGRV